MTKEIKHLRFSENNDWEGETWHFYFEANENNKKAFEILEKILKKFELGEDDYGLFELGSNTLTAKQIGELPDNGSYMMEHNLVKWNLDIKKLEEILKKNEYDIEFYKWRIIDFTI